MKLGDILALQPGELIKGAHVKDVTISADPTWGQVPTFFLNKDGWIINNVKAEKISSKPDDTVRIMPLTFVQDRDITDLGNRVSKITPDSQLQAELHQKVFSKNSKYLKTLMDKPCDFYAISQGEIVGMSLGETVLMFVPQMDGGYRSDFYDICCWHRILHKNKVIWLLMTTTVRVNFYKAALSDMTQAEMEIV
jgi:hypothetical protein